MVGPAVWRHEKLIWSPSGSELALPSSTTVAPGFTAWSAPAFAVGGRFAGAGIGFTVTFTNAGELIGPPAETTSSKVSTLGAETCGAVKVTIALAWLLNATSGPPT